MSNLAIKYVNKSHMVLDVERADCEKHHLCSFWSQIPTQKKAEVPSRHITLGGRGGGAKSTIGIMNFNLRVSEIRNMRKICLNQPLTL